MKTGMVYTNSSGDSFDFDQSGVYPVPHEAWDWEYGVETLNGEFASYYRGQRDLVIPVTFTGTNFRQAMESLYDVVSRDIADGAAGTLSIGEWSMPAVMTKSVKSLWWKENGPSFYDLTFSSPRPWWTRPSEFQFFAVDQSPEGLDYPHDFAFDYGSSGQASFIAVGGAYPADFLLRVYGPAVNPYVLIAGNRYEVDVSVPDGGLLEIDSSAGTVTLKTAQGTASNAFGATPDAAPGSGEYVFERIPVGNASLSWSGAFGFDLVVYERRDERAWTD